MKKPLLTLTVITALGMPTFTFAQLGGTGSSGTSSTGTTGSGTTTGTSTTAAPTGTTSSGAFGTTGTSTGTTGTTAAPSSTMVPSTLSESNRSPSSLGTTGSTTGINSQTTGAGVTGGTTTDSFGGNATSTGAGGTGSTTIPSPGTGTANTQAQPVTPPSTTSNSAITDSDLTNLARQTLANDTSLSPAGRNVRVVISNNQAIITGAVESMEERQRISDMIRTTTGVHEINDNTRVLE